MLQVRCKNNHITKSFPEGTSLLDVYQGKVPFLLSGGIGPDDAQRIKAIHHPQFAGIDINSRFEIEPGLKDVASIKRFLEELRA